MLRVLLGGIAGVATGYALKQYLDEEECSYSNSHTDEEEKSKASYPWFIIRTDIALERLNDYKQKLQTTLFKETAVLMQSLNMPVPTETINTDSVILKDTLENTGILERFLELLCETEKLQYERLHVLEEILIHADDLSEVEDEDRRKVSYLFLVDTWMREACSIALTYNDESISLPAKKAFYRLIVREDKDGLFWKSPDL